MSTMELKFVPYVPDGFEGAPVDVVDALTRGKAVLTEEDRWVRSAWFENEHPEGNVQDPFCNSWKVCAEGAVLVVTVGLHNRPLLLAIEERSDLKYACPWAVFDQLVSADYGDVEDDEDLLEHADPVQRGLYGAAIEQLRLAGEAITGQSHDVAHAYNDVVFATRDDVVAWFDRAIEDAQR